MTRPIPDDFRDHAPTESTAGLMKRYRCSRLTIMAWAKEAAIERKTTKGNPYVPTPADFAKQASILHVSALCRHYLRGPKMIKIWLEREGITPIKAPPGPPPPSGLKVVPGDFQASADRMCRDELVVHYGCSRNTLTRWIKESGIEPIAPPRKTVEKPAKVVHFVRPSYSPSMIPQRESGRAADAQLILQRRYSVYRQRIVNPMAPADMWVVAGRVVHESDMIRMAEKVAA